MMNLWLNRYIRRATPLPSAALSLGVHAVVISAWVVATASAGVEETELPENSIARFLAPPNRIAGQEAQREMVRYVAIAIPGPSSVGTLVQPVDSIEPLAPISGLDERDALALPELPGADSVFLVVEVDSAVTRYEWSAAPAYPPTMLEQKVSGFVQAQWVVDETGYADTTSLQILEATHSEFAKAVRDALPFMRFRPAKIGPKPVKQLVQQDFSFRITTAAADSLVARNRTPPP